MQFRFSWPERSLTLKAGQALRPMRDNAQEKYEAFAFVRKRALDPMRLPECIQELA